MKTRTKTRGLFAHWHSKEGFVVVENYLRIRNAYCWQSESEIGSEECRVLYLFRVHLLFIALSISGPWFITFHLLFFSCRSFSRFLSNDIAEILFEELLYAVDESNDTRLDTETERIKVSFSLSLSFALWLDTNEIRRTDSMHRADLVPFGQIRLHMMK